MKFSVPSSSPIPAVIIVGLVADFVGALSVRTIGGGETSVGMFAVAVTTLRSFKGTVVELGLSGTKSGNEAESLLGELNRESSFENDLLKSVNFHTVLAFGMIPVLWDVG